MTNNIGFLIDYGGIDIRMSGNNTEDLSTRYLRGIFDVTHTLTSRSSKNEILKNQRFMTTDVEGNNYGKTNLPRSNKVPISIAVTAEGLPHSQVASEGYGNRSIAEINFPTEFVPKVQMVPMSRTELIIPVYRCKQLSSDTLPLLLNSILTPFFQLGTTQIVPTFIDFLRGITSLFGSYDTLLHENELSMAVRDLDVSIKYDPYETAPEYAKAMDSETNGAFSSVYKFFENNGILNSSSMCALVFPVLMTLGKNVNSANYDNWYLARMRAACAICSGTDFELLKSIRPDLDAMSGSYALYSSAFYFKRVIFTRIVQYSKVVTMLCSVFYLTVKLLAFTDISYVLNIDFYLLGMMPELLNCQLLRNYEGVLVKMMEFCLKYRDILPFVRFLVPPEECHAINRNTLRNLTSAATAIAKLNVDSFANYRGGDQETKFYGKVFNLVTNYMGARQQTAIAGMAVSSRANMTDLEAQMIVKDQISKGEARTLSIVNETNENEFT